LRILAVDPGSTTGYAVIEEGQVATFGSPTGQDEIWQWYEWIEDQYFDVFVIEDFRIRPGVNFSWSQLFPIQVIGALKYLAWKKGAEIVIQQASIKPAAYGQIGLKYEKGKQGMHIKDAVAHGMWWWNHTGVKRVEEETH
jgi:hypothetical protein